jgi:hypothetical protein
MAVHRVPEYHYGLEIPCENHLALLTCSDQVLGNARTSILLILSTITQLAQKKCGRQLNRDESRSYMDYQHQRDN